MGLHIDQARHARRRAQQPGHGDDAHGFAHRAYNEPVTAVAHRVQDTELFSALGEKGIAQDSQGDGRDEGDDALDYGKQQEHRLDRSPVLTQLCLVGSHGRLFRGYALLQPTVEFTLPPLSWDDEQADRIG